MNHAYTAVVKQDGPWWIGWVEEIPGVNCVSGQCDYATAIHGRSLARRYWYRVSRPLLAAAAVPPRPAGVGSLRPPALASRCRKPGPACRPAQERAFDHAPAARG